MTSAPIRRLYQSDPADSSTTPVLPTVDDQDAWRRLLNRLFLWEEDDLFRWAQSVMATVCSEREKPAATENRR